MIEQPFEAKNLDGLWPDDLDALASEYQAKRVRGMFGDCVASKLERYCRLKACAMRDRAAGDIGAALTQEAWCARIYRTLPDWARW